MGAYGMSNKSPYRSGSGLASATTPKIEEDLSSQLDGSAVDFTISRSFNASSIDVYYNGLKQRKPDEFNVTGGNSIQTNFTPTATSKLTVAYYTS